MRIALVDSNPRPKVYPLALLKLGAWRKDLGDDCTLYNDRLPSEGEADEIWITTTFTYDIPHALGLVREAKGRAGVVRVGGIAATLLPEHFEREGVEVHKGLVDEAEDYSPDYGLLTEPPRYSITHTSRGCVRKCGFCMVHRLEPTFGDRLRWDKDISPGATKVLFYDNNWFAKGIDGMGRDVARLRTLIDEGQVTEVDFNQGLDCRLLTEEMADLLAGLPIRPVRFAFDGMHEDGHYQRAVTMMAERGHRVFWSYVLYNFKDTPQDFYYRLKKSVQLSAELGVTVNSFPMRYQPILNIDTDREYVGANWTARKKKGVMSVLGVCAITGQVSTHSLAEFEYWFGKDADEFDRLLSYPRARELAQRKKGALRLRRMGLEARAVV